MTLDADTAIYRFGHELNAWCHNSARVKQTSSLYDLPGRSSIGFALLYDAVPEFLRRLEPFIDAEEVGRRMRAPLMRPYFVQLLIVIESWLMGRERLIMDAGERLPAGVDPERDRADWELVGSWFARAGGAARGDGEAFSTRAELFAEGRLRAGETVRSQPLLDEDALVGLGADDEPLDPDVAQRVQRAFGAIELYAMTLHGEQRDGLYDHGPAARPDGWSVVVHEVNDLSNDVLPWSTEDVRLGADAVGVVRAYRPEVDLSIDMWGTLAVRPLGPPDELRALWVRQGDELRRLDVDELEALAARALEAMTALYGTMAAWEPDYRIAYGAPLFVNHLVPFARLGGAAELERWLWEREAAVVAAWLPELRGAPAHPSWARRARTDTDVVFTYPERRP
jgi:hypothetical protein